MQQNDVPTKICFLTHQSILVKLDDLIYSVPPMHKPIDGNKIWPLPISLILSVITTSSKHCHSLLKCHQLLPLECQCQQAQLSTNHALQSWKSSGWFSETPPCPPMKPWLNSTSNWTPIPLPYTRASAMANFAFSPSQSLSQSLCLPLPLCAPHQPSFHSHHQCQCFCSKDR